MTISPSYQTKGVPNPYYTITDSIDRNILTKLKKEYNILKSEVLRYKCIDKPSQKQTSIYDSRGKFIFQVEFFDTKSKNILATEYYISLPTKEIKSHYGGASRKDSTASSNVNEFLSLYFLKHDFKDVKSFMKMVSKEKSGTGIFTGEEEEVTHQELNKLIDMDETPERDIEIGYKNSIEVRADLKKNKQTYAKLYWTPRKKPGGVHKNNPSDVIVLTATGCYIGYSNKIASGAKDETPKFNTNLFAFFGKMGNTAQQKKSVGWMDNSWNDAVKNVKSNTLSKKSIQNINIENEAPSESSSAKVFADIGKIFKKDKLDFFKKDFYYIYRENLINHVMKHISNKNNLVYFLNTVGFYTFGVSIGTPCPYKLLVGRPTGASTIKEVTKNEEFRELLENKDSSIFKNIKTSHVNGTQQFTISFKFFHHMIEIPMTIRTRASGGWSGKSLYLTTSGVVMTK